MRAAMALPALTLTLWACIPLLSVLAATTSSSQTSHSTTVSSSTSSPSISFSTISSATSSSQSSLSSATSILTLSGASSFTLPTSSVSLVSLLSTNPTAVPLSSITIGALTQSTVPLSSTASPGATPPIKGAPPLPTFVYSPSLGYPALDQVPDTNSSQVQQWIKEVQNSGISIPDLEQSQLGGCIANPGLVTNTSRCWWTCGGCTRPSDIVTCPDKMTWGLSYDDGPSPWTSDLLNYINANGLNTTFFIVGSRAISRPDVLQAEYMSGHQLCVHTWSHPYLTTLTTPQIIAELGWTKKAIKDITGVTPNTWRPPYGDVDDRVRAIAQAMGLTTIIWSSYNGQDFDTNDWHIPAGYPVNQVIDNFETILTDAKQLNTGFIVLEHDLYQQTVDLAIGYILPNALASKIYAMKSIIYCLHKPLEDAYIETNNNATNPPSNGATTLSPGQTGALTGQTSPTSSSGHKGAAFMNTQISLGGILGASIMVVAGVFGGVMLV